jgi:hypothetical protein
MMAKRTLSEEEMHRLAEDRRLKEIAAHPNKMISVHVELETDENGDAIVSVWFVGERRSRPVRR